MKIIKSKIIKNICIFLTAFFCTLLVNLQLFHYHNHGHFVSYGLHVHSKNENYNISIPGQTKLYWAEITNYSFFKVKIIQCDFITDAQQPGSELPYAVQRWSIELKKWETIESVTKQGFCKPYPTGKSRTKIVSKWLLPLETKRVMDWEATGATEPFQKGDMARFVVFTNIENGIDWQNAIPSVPFYIEDDVIRYEK